MLRNGVFCGGAFNEELCYEIGLHYINYAYTMEEVALFPDMHCEHWYQYKSYYSALFMRMLM